MRMKNIDSVRMRKIFHKNHYNIEWEWWKCCHEDHYNIEIWEWEWGKCFHDNYFLNMFCGYRLQQVVPQGAADWGNKRSIYSFLCFFFFIEVSHIYHSCTTELYSKIVQTFFYDLLVVFNGQWSSWLMINSFLLRACNFWLKWKQSGAR